MARDFKIDSVLSSEEWEGNFGPMVSYRLSLEGEAEDVDLNQRPETPPPTEGQVLYGDLITGKYRPKLKKAQREGGGFSSPPRGFSPMPGGRSPDQQNAIQRQHSQEMAIRWNAQIGAAKKVNELKPIIDWFERDISSSSHDAPPSPGSDGAGAVTAPRPIGADAASGLLREVNAVGLEDKQVLAKLVTLDVVGHSTVSAALAHLPESQLETFRVWLTAIGSLPEAA